MNSGACLYLTIYGKVKTINLLKNRFVLCFFAYHNGLDWQQKKTHQFPFMILLNKLTRTNPRFTQFP